MDFGVIAISMILSLSISNILKGVLKFIAHWSNAPSSKLTFVFLSVTAKFRYHWYNGPHLTSFTYSQVLTWVCQEKCGSVRPSVHKMCISGPFWAHFGWFRRLFGPFWVVSRPFQRHLGLLGPFFGPFWVFPAILAAFWAFLGHFWPISVVTRPLRGVSQAFLAHFGWFSGHFGSLWVVSRPFRGVSQVFLANFWWFWTNFGWFSGHFEGYRRDFWLI